MRLRGTPQYDPIVMHLLIIPSWYPATPQDMSGSFFREQAVELAKRLPRVGVIFPELISLRAIGDPNSRRRGLVYRLDDGVHEYRWETYNLTPRISRGLHQQWIRRGLRLFQAYVEEQGMPDVIHAHCMLYAGVLAVALKQRFGVPVVLTEHSTAYAKQAYGRFDMALAAATASKCDRRIAVSKDLAWKLKSIVTRSDPAPWLEIPNLVNAAFLTYPTAKRDKRNFVFFSAGLLRPIKRQDILIRAFAEAFAHDDTVSLKIAGDGPEKDRLAKLITGLKLDSRVELIGTVMRSEMPSNLASSDAFVLSSEFETFGVVLIEALAIGLPVISTRCGGPNDLIKVTDGILTPVNDVAALALAMNRVRNGDAAFDPFGIRQACRERFGADAVCSSLKKIYDRLFLERACERRNVTNAA